MKLNERKRESSPRTVSVGSGAKIYALLFVGALIFTQALRSRASSVFFIFVLMLPPAMLIYALLGRTALRVIMLSESATVEKQTPYTYKIRLVNEWILAYPFVEADIRLPDADCVGTYLHRVKLALPPLSDYTVNNTAAFRYRGMYEIGVERLYIYDFFRIFKICMPTDAKHAVSVLPRRRLIEFSGGEATSDSASKSPKKSESYERLEISDIREYMLGDQLKSIHWKLSTKSEELLVREYDAGASKTTYVLCDLSEQYPSESAQADGREESVGSPFELSEERYYRDMNPYTADGIVELTVAAVLDLIRRGNRCTLIWFDSREKFGHHIFDISSSEHLDAIFTLFGTAPSSPRDLGADRLAELLGGDSISDDSKYILVTTLGNEESVERVADAFVRLGSPREGARVLLYEPEGRFADADARRQYVANCRDRLASQGLEPYVYTFGGGKANG